MPKHSDSPTKGIPYFYGNPKVEADFFMKYPLLN